MSQDPLEPIAAPMPFEVSIRIEDEAGEFRPYVTHAERETKLRLYKTFAAALWQASQFISVSMQIQEATRG